MFYCWLNPFLCWCLSCLHNVLSALVHVYDVTTKLTTITMCVCVCVCVCCTEPFVVFSFAVYTHCSARYCYSLWCRGTNTLMRGTQRKSWKCRIWVTSLQFCRFQSDQSGHGQRRHSSQWTVTGGWESIQAAMWNEVRKAEVWDRKGWEWRGVEVLGEGQQGLSKSPANS